MTTKNLFITIIACLICTGVYTQSVNHWQDLLPKEKVENGTLTLKDIQNAFYGFWEPFDVRDGYYLENGKRIKVAEWNHFKRWEWQMEYQVDAEGNFSTISTPEAMQNYYDQYPQYTRNISGEWTNIGFNQTPGGYQGVGRVNDILVVPWEPNTIFVGTASGGLWVTHDSGNTWAPLTDDLPTLGVSAIAFHWKDGNSIIYIGTGDRDLGSFWNLNVGQPDIHDAEGTGVWKSLDGGASWEQTELKFQPSQKVVVNDILIDSKDNIFVATSNGLYKSMDDLTSMPPLIQAGNIIDMEFKMGNDKIIFAAPFDVNVPHNHIFRFRERGTILPPDVINLPNSIDIYRSEIEVCYMDTNAVWMLATHGYIQHPNGNGNGLEGLYKSEDGGTTFKRKKDFFPNLLGRDCNGMDWGGQGTYDLTMVINPADSAEIWVGGVNIWRTTQGTQAGAVWEIITHWQGDCGGVAENVHADVHYMDFTNPWNLFVGNDGGIYHANFAGGNWNWNDLSSGLTINQVYRIGGSPQASDDVIIGTQDNGLHIWNSGTWMDNPDIGDGMECLIDPTDKDTQLGEAFNGIIFRTEDLWTTKMNVQENLQNSVGGAAYQPTGSWVTPFMLDPNDPNHLYVGYQELYHSADQGQTANFDSLTTFGNQNRKIRSFTISPANSDIIFIAFDDLVHRTTDGGTTWDLINDNLPNTGLITYLAVDYADPDILWLTMGGYDANAVFETQNACGNPNDIDWINISTGLPQIPALSIVQNRISLLEKELYVSMTNGVYVKPGNEDWMPFSNNLPNVACTELEIYYDETTPANSRLRVGTYGRGLWQSPLFDFGENHWWGPESPDWFDGDNWSAGVPPSSLYNAIVPDISKGFDPVISNVQEATVHDLTLEAGASLTLNPGSQLSISGHITNNAGMDALVLQADATGYASLLHQNADVDGSAQSFISQDVWHLVASPMENALSGVFTGLYLNYWTEATRQWTSIVSTTYPLSPGQGFSAYSDGGSTGNYTISYIDQMNNGDIMLSLSYTPVGEVEAGWHLVGNPFPSSITWNENWSQVNVDNTIYVYNGSNHLTWNHNYGNGFGTKGNGDIAVGQGFWVKANNEGASLIIPQDARIHSSEAFLKSDGEFDGMLHLSIEGNNHEDRAILWINPEAEIPRDQQLNAWKRWGNTDAPQLYFSIQKGEFSVLCMPMHIDHLVIPLSAEIPYVGIFDLKFYGLDGFDENIELFLEDLKEGIIYEIDNPSGIQFAADVNDDPHRFLLHITEGQQFDQDGLKPLRQADIHAYGSSVYIAGMHNKTGQLRIFDIAGRILFEKEIEGDLVKIQLQQYTGICLVQLIEGNRSRFHKVLIQ